MSHVTYYANHLAFVVLKSIAFDQRGANKDVGDLIHVLMYGPELEEAARLFAEAYDQGSHRASLEKALDCLRRGFCSHADTDGHLMKGSVAYGAFHQPDDADARVEFQRQASALVSRYLALIDQALHKR